jgi:hypothetical protein
MAHYKVLFAQDNVRCLEVQVNDYLSKGYTLAGSLNVVWEPDVSKLVYYQAVVCNSETHL